MITNRLTHYRGASLTAPDKLRRQLEIALEQSRDMGKIEAQRRLYHAEAVYLYRRLEHRRLKPHSKSSGDAADQ